MCLERRYQKCSKYSGKLHWINDEIYPEFIFNATLRKSFKISGANQRSRLHSIKQFKTNEKLIWPEESVLANMASQSLRKMTHSQIKWINNWEQKFDQNNNYNKHYIN